jgi:hypothetical protein
MSQNPPQEPKKEDKDQSVVAMLEQLTREAANTRQTVESLKEKLEEKSEEPGEIDPLNPPVMDFADADTRSVFETNLSALTRVQKSFAQQEAKGVALESFQRGLEEVPVDVQNRASRLEMAWWQSDQQFGHLLSKRGGGAGLWLSKHLTTVLIAIVGGVLGAIALVRLTDPAFLDTVGAQWGSLSELQQFLFLGMICSVIIVALVFLWLKQRASRPRTAGSVSQ